MFLDANDELVNSEDLFKVCKEYENDDSLNAFIINQQWSKTDAASNSNTTSKTIINFKNINLDNYSCFENYLISFFEEIFEFLNIKINFKIEKSKFCSSYIAAINKFAKEKKRPLGKRILMPCFNIEYKISKRELINLKNILV